MNRLISLELKRNRFHSYHMAVLIITVVMLGMIYLLVCIPRMDPADTDLQMFQSYYGLIGLENLLLITIFIIFSAAISGKLIVEEYSGKRAILLFSYPVARQKILGAKMFMVYGYTVVAMFLTGVVVYGIFFLTEAIFPLCVDQMTIGTVIYGAVSLACYSLIAGVWGIISLWIGFRRQSVTVTMVAAVIISVIMCQVMSMTMSYMLGAILFLVIGVVAALVVWGKLKDRVENMEV